MTSEGRRLSSRYVGVIKVTGTSYREVVERLEELAMDLATYQDAAARESVGSRGIFVVCPDEVAPVVDWKEGSRG